MSEEKKSAKISLANISFSVLFFYLFIFCLPFLKRIEILTDFSYLDGRFIEYLTYIVYGFEVFFGAALLLWISEIIRWKEKVLLGDTRILFSWLAMIAFSSLSLFFAESVFTGAYYILVLFWLFIIYLFVVNKIKTTTECFLLLNVFVLSMFLQSVLAIAQFVKNGSVGLYLLGEQILSSNMPGVAKIVMGGSNHIRPYGTFSHPNVLALFLLIAGIVAIHLFYQSRSNKYRFYSALMMIVLAVALVLTFSRIVWVAALLLWGGMILQKIRVSREKIKVRNIYLIIIAAILLIIGVLLSSAIWWRINPFLLSTWGSLQVRSVVLLRSWVLVKGHLLGIGIGNFIIEVAYLLTGYPIWVVEPAHNTFVMVLAEIGVLGLASFLSLLYFTARKIIGAPIFLRYIFVAFVFLMFFDHYFWDIRQAQILLFLFLGLMVNPVRTLFEN